MPIRTALWKVGSPPQMLTESILASEQLRENMIISAPRMLSDEWMLIGNQNTICKPTTPKWRSTVDCLKVKFPNFDQDKS